MPPSQKSYQAEVLKRRHDTQPDDTQHNDIQHYDTQPNEIQHDNT